MTRVGGLRCEYLVDPTGVGETQPRLSWMLDSADSNVAQHAYQVQVASTPKFAPADILWDTSRQAGPATTGVAYSGPALSSRQVCFWRVRAWTDGATATRWSRPGGWEMGLLRPRDWSARWITSAAARRKTNRPVLYMRREFTLRGPVRIARVYATAHGLYQLRLNGELRSDAVFAPGWTDYREMTQYQVYDVAGLLKPGTNTVGLVLNEGWYCGPVSIFGPNRYGTQPAALLQLEVEYADGTRETVVTDKSWRVSEGPIRTSGILAGEVYDSRMEIPGWDRSGFDDKGWAPVQEQRRKTTLVAEVAPPVRRTATLRPKVVSDRDNGTRLYDLGQNISGWARLKLRAGEERSVRLRHAEVLNSDGSPYYTNLRSAPPPTCASLMASGRSSTSRPSPTTAFGTSRRRASAVAAPRLAGGGRGAL